MNESEVQITSASKAAANSLANRSPPCLCPPKRVITFFAFESVTNIAGSFSLDRIKGAISLTTAPIEPTKINLLLPCH